MLRNAPFALLILGLGSVAAYASPPPDDTEVQAAAAIAAGDALFDRQAFPDALAAYDTVAASAARHSGYAHYKGAWCLFNLSRFDEALARFVALARAGRAANASDAERQIGREALTDTVTAFARVGKPADAYRFYAELAPERRLDLTERVAERMLDDSRAHDADAILGTLTAAVETEPALAVERPRAVRYARLCLEGAWQTRAPDDLRAASAALLRAWTLARTALGATRAAELEPEHDRLRALVRDLLGHLAAEAAKTRAPASPQSPFSVLRAGYLALFPSDAATLPALPAR